MDRRQRKREQKKKRRDLVKKKARAAFERRPDPEQLLLRAAARSPFGPCYISVGWTLEEESPELVSIVVTRRLPDGDLVPAMALVDRTCLGIKSGFTRRKVTDDGLRDLIADVGAPHGGMAPCEPLTAQSVVYHAIDYANRLGFAPDPDFPEVLFGPRPTELLDTPWHAAARPIYMQGPHDDIQEILPQLVAAVGADGFTYIDAVGVAEAELRTLYEDDDEPEDATAGADERSQ